MKKQIARMAQGGSGSACRSIEGPWVEWDSKDGVSVFENPKVRFVDFILLLEEGHKQVSSSDAHERVKTSPLFADRKKRAEDRLTRVKAALLKNDLPLIQKIVLTETKDMHELFHTSHPSFGYLNEESHRWIQRIESNAPELPTPNGILTFDAGANAHLFVPESEALVWKNYLEQLRPKFKYWMSAAGKGARYESK